MAVHIGFDLGDAHRLDRRRLGKVEAQAVGRDEAALLRDMQAEPLAQRLVQQVSRRMVGADRAAPPMVDGQAHGIAHRDIAGLDIKTVGPEAPEMLLRILDRAAQALLAGNRPGIADLAAAFAIEGRLVDDEVDRVALPRRDRLAGRP